jgi:hypothetical protein
MVTANACQGSGQDERQKHSRDAQVKKIVINGTLTWIHTGPYQSCYTGVGSLRPLSSCNASIIAVGDVRDFKVATIGIQGGDVNLELQCSAHQPLVQCLDNTSKTPDKLSDVFVDAPSVPS